ncbi:MAG: hypothetical protein J3Q66DRAFT_350261 [Benniella sp.]|nr:MAG: hypothetical protein J3Q66DRAFT_350261 [Benniella sp.]
MFGLPEIDDKICRLLDRHALAQCVQVSKAWHYIVIPYLWHDIKYMSYPEQKAAFRNMVMQDFLCEQQRRQLQEEGHETEHSQTPPSPFTSSLKKYGPWIRKLPGPGSLLLRLHPQLCSVPLQPEGEIKEPTAPELLHHLYKHCTAIQMHELDLSAEYLECNDLLRTLGEYVIPHVRHLLIGSSYRHRFIESWRLKYLLDRCSNTLEKLSLFVDVSYIEDREFDVDDEQQAMEPKGWTSLKELKLMVFNDISDSQAFMPWFWKRCSRVERLEIYGISGMAQSVADTMLAHMPNLNEIHLGRDSRDVQGLADEETAAILAGSRQGWKTIEFKCAMKIGVAAKESLEKHYPTLEALAVYECDAFTGYDLTQVLISSPNLHTLAAIEDGYCLRRNYLHLTASSFIDRDPIRGLLRPWGCESTLRVLEVVIAGIPRPDLDGIGVIEELYPGQGREMQNLVYDRLARFTNVEILWLGHGPNITHVEVKKPRQGDCLEMSLESGLYKLAGLKALKELNLWGMRLRIGSKEVKWMVENWPELRAIYGLEEWHGSEGAKWLREYHPEIDLRKLW